MIMHDDFVARRAALDTWVKRWVASVKIDHPSPRGVAGVFVELHGQPAWEAMAKAALLDKVLIGMLNEEAQVKSFGFEVTEDEVNRVGTLRLSVILEKPHG